jgi:N4-gp56 family major capsid protein
MIITSDTLPPQVQAKFDDKLLSVRTPSLIHTVACLGKKLASKSGKTIRFSRYNRLPTFPAPLGTSGAPIPATAVTRTDLDATTSFYGYTAVVKSSLIILNAYDAIALG